MKMHRCFLAGLMVIVILACTVFLVGANSAIWIWEGSANTGSMVSGEDCPVVVEKELLIFDIPNLPMEDHNKGNKNYSASVTAEYTLVNPSREEITMELIFPFGEKPEYYYSWGLSESLQLPYAVTAGDKELPYTIRHIGTVGHSPVVSYDAFGKISASYLEDDFYRPDLPVTVYTYEIKNSKGSLFNTQQYAYIGFQRPELPEGSRIAFPELRNYGDTYDARDAYFTLCCYDSEAAVASAPRSLKVYVLGEPLAEPLKPAVFGKWNDRYHYFDQDHDPEGYFGEPTVETVTLLELTDSLNPPEREISSLDWYNAMVCKMLSDEGENPGGILTLDQTFPYAEYMMYTEDWDAPYDIRTEFYMNSSGDWEYDPPTLGERMMCCYVYSLTMQPGEKLVHRVTAPLYPTVVYDMGLTSFKFLYILSAAESWGDFGDLEIRIRTPGALQYSNIEGFVKEDWGYSFASQGLPEGDLYFNLGEIPLIVDIEDSSEEHTDTTAPDTIQVTEDPNTPVADPIPKKRSMVLRLLLSVAAMAGCTGILCLFFRTKREDEKK
ncbi:MAG: hypothetical protein IKM59_05235 [Oscillospiraceae bacterium]|nr:hypothetical protein [Oscillospiraceae bacterium]